MYVLHIHYKPNKQSKTLSQKDSSLHLYPLIPQALNPKFYIKMQTRKEGYLLCLSSQFTITTELNASWIESLCTIDFYS
jgi:hypothetical protein